MLQKGIFPFPLLENPDRETTTRLTQLKSPELGPTYEPVRYPTKYLHPGHTSELYVPV